MQRRLTLLNSIGKFLYSTVNGNYLEADQHINNLEDQLSNEELSVFELNPLPEFQLDQYNLQTLSDIGQGYSDEQLKKIAAELVQSINTTLDILSRDSKAAAYLSKYKGKLDYILELLEV